MKSEQLSNLIDYLDLKSPKTPVNVSYIGYFTKVDSKGRTYHINAYRYGENMGNIFFVAMIGVIFNDYIQLETISIVDNCCVITDDVSIPQELKNILIFIHKNHILS